ncbi:SAM-dependent chlorinase/fluorinase [candidate division KSB1 bacterium]|nr:SAM-dependent chlorinase/fluorinase [candidate division KSB1 bacterium]
MERAVISLLTDFGDQDGFTGIMKGVILRINPAVRIVDLSHRVPAHQVDAAAFVLHTAHSYFPAGTIHVVVVDPGVGSDRKIIACEANTQIFLAPDNEVLKYIFHEFGIDSVIHVTNQRYFLPVTSQTFHGRDIFAPVAAHLSTGIELHELGESTTDFLPGAVIEPLISETSIQGQILHIDTFGNLLTNIPKTCLPRSSDYAELSITGKQLDIKGISNSYTESVGQEPVAILGSHGYLEIAINQHRASDTLKLKPGDKIAIRWK